MVVGEPSLMGGEFGEEDERLISRLENSQFDQRPQQLRQLFKVARVAHLRLVPLEVPVKEVPTKEVLLDQDQWDSVLVLGYQVQEWDPWAAVV